MFLLYKRLIRSFLVQIQLDYLDKCFDLKNFIYYFLKDQKSSMSEILNLKKKILF